MNTVRPLSIVLLLVALGAAAWTWLQRAEAEVLRAQLAQLHDGQRESARLRTEHRLLSAAQPPAEELRRLRADRAALVRLRAELDYLRSRAANYEDLEASANSRLVRAPVPGTITVNTGIADDGSLSFDGVPSALEMLRARLAGAQRGDRVELRVSTPVVWPVDSSEIKRTIDQVVRMGNELGRAGGFTCSLKMEPRGGT